MKKINAASIVRDLRFDSALARDVYMEKQTATAQRRKQAEPWFVPYDSPDPAFPFGLVCGTAYNSSPMWEP